MSSAEYSCKLLEAIFCIPANSVDPDQTAPLQTVWTQIRLLLKEQSDLGPHCLQKLLLKSQAEDKADNNCYDWRFKVHVSSTSFPTGTIPIISAVML